MGQLEGLSLLLQSDLWKLPTCIKKDRALYMVRLKPKIFETDLLGKKRDPKLYTDYVKSTLDLTKTAKDFCESISDGLKFAPTKIIVKNISYKVKQHELWTFFERYGKVLRATIVTERRSRRSRGFGFVVFANPLDAERALKSRKTQLHLKGRYMQVLPGTRKKGSMYSAKNAFKDWISWVIISGAAVFSALDLLF